MTNRIKFYGTVAAVFISIAIGGALITHHKNVIPESTWDDRAVRYQHTPITVDWKRQDFEDYNPSIRAAISIWNGRAGCVVLKEVSGSHNPDILIKMEDGATCGGPVVDDNPRAAAYTMWCPAIGHSDIVIKQMDEQLLAMRALGHELGHGIGLADDFGNEGGIMHYELAVPAEGDTPEQLGPNNQDIDAIRARYCTGKP